MNNKSETGVKTSRKIGRYLFIGILALHTLGCYAMGITTLLNPQVAFESGFQIDYNPELTIIGTIIGMELLFLGSIALLGIIWTRKNKKEGIVAGVAVGVYMFLFGFAALIFVGETQALIVDSIRGFLTLVFGYMAYQEIKNNKV
jgi:hypothetical protein